MVVVYSAEFGYIYIQLIVRELTPESIPGGTVFIIYAFFNFLVIISMVIQVLVFGSHVNMIDGKIRKELNENRTSAIEAKSLCELGHIYKKKDGKPISKENMILLFNAKNEDGVTYYFSHQGEKFANIDAYESISDEVMTNINIYLDSVDPAEKRIKNKIKQDSLKFLGLEMNYELVYKLIYVIVAIVAGMVQKFVKEKDPNSDL